VRQKYKSMTIGEHTIAEEQNIDKKPENKKEF